MPASTIDPRQLRKALGTFMTGVTVVTTLDAQGEPRGFTANSFTSVSLEPPLVLVCIDHSAPNYAVYSAAEHFAVNILSEEQRDISSVFAGQGGDKFAAVDWHAGRIGSPIIAGSLAWVACRVHQRVEAGDHLILIGRVEDFHYTPANPLGYFRGAYLASALEQDALPAPGQRTRVGAILESDGCVLLVEDRKTGQLTLPSGARLAPASDPASLLARLRALQIDAEVGFIFAVFEDDSSGTLNVYYRGQIRGLPNAGDGLALIPFEEVPWDRLPDGAMRSMLGRYVSERVEDRFGIYVGDFEAGEVHTLGPRRA